MRALLAPALVVIAGVFLVSLWAPAAGAQEADPSATTLPPLQEQRPLPTRVTTPPSPASTSTTPTSAAVTTPRSDSTLAPINKGEGLNNALPRPNSGHAPEYQGDRGTGSQYAVFGAMLLAFGVIIALVVRQSRRSKARWSAAAPMAGTSQSDSRTSDTP